MDHLEDHRADHLEDRVVDHEAAACPEEHYEDPSAVACPVDHAVACQEVPSEDQEEQLRRSSRSRQAVFLAS